MGAIHNAALEQLRASAGMGDHMDTEGEKVVACLEKRFAELYYLLMNNGLLRQLKKLLELQELNGAFEDQEGVLKGNKELYKSARSVRDILECIAAVVRQGIVDEVRRSKVVAMMFDETTDVSEWRDMDDRMVQYSGAIKY
jgi:hypothetical protein